MITMFEHQNGKFPIGKNHLVVTGKRKTMLYHRKSGTVQSFPKASVNITTVSND